MIETGMLLFLGVITPILLILASGVLKTVTLNPGRPRSHDYHLGIEFALAHITVCVAIFFDAYRRVKSGKIPLEDFPHIAIVLAVAGIIGAAILLFLVVGYQSLKCPSLDHDGNIKKDVHGRIIRIGNERNHHNLTNDFMTGVIYYNALAVLPFTGLLFWLLLHE